MSRGKEISFIEENINFNISTFIKMLMDSIFFIPLEKGFYVEKMTKEFFLIFYSKKFKVLPFMFKPLIYLKLIFNPCEVDIYSLLPSCKLLLSA